MQPTDLAWGAILASAAGLQIWAIRRGRHGEGGKFEGTLSNLVRRLFRPNTIAGRVVFAAAWLAFAAWFLYHILFEPCPSSEARDEH